MSARINLAFVSTIAIASACGAHPSAGPAPAKPGPGSRAALTRMIDSMVGAPEFRTAMWGVLIVDPIKHDTLYRHNAEKLFIPASNEKIVTSTVALEQLGPEYRFRTSIAARGTMSNGTLAGDLAVVGRGDPTVSDHMKGDAMIPLRAIADSLWQRGLRHVTGNVVAVGDAFPGPVAGAAWPWDGLDGASFAGVDELLFNEGLVSLHVRAGAKAGDLAMVETKPAKTYPHVRVLAKTVARVVEVDGGQLTSRQPRVTRISAYHDTLTSDVVVRGQIAVGDTATVSFPQHDPDAAYVAALTEALVDRGIVVDHQASSWNEDPHADSLLTVLSAPLKEIMPALMKPSQNQIAEVLLRTLGLEKGGLGTADSGRRVIARQFDQWKIPADGYVVRDGSGLSRSDLVSPETIVSLLDVMRRSPNFDLFYSSLPIAGVDGTIRTRMRGTPAQSNLRAKTGTLSMVRSLSGYVTTADGQLLEFSTLCNNWTTPQAAVDKVQDTIGATLAQMKLR